MVNGIIIINSGSGATINSGNPIWLVDAQIQKGWKNLNSVDPTPGLYDCVEARQGGIENPKIVISGFIDIHATSGTWTINGMANCSKITEKFLLSMSCLRQTTASYLVMKTMYGTNSASILGRDTSSGYPNTTNSINVVIDDWNIKIPSDSHYNHMWEYSISLTETKNVS